MVASNLILKGFELYVLVFLTIPPPILMSVKPGTAQTDPILK